ncbi:hypothetical protein Pfo_000263 [Paulownia fortunei]|nr:hypothetical protein Pfo_000263 [Paulownia fortunei]
MSFENDGARLKTGGDISVELGSREAIQIEGAETEVTKGLKKEAKHHPAEEDARLNSTPEKENCKKKIKWKKIISSALNSLYAPWSFGAVKNTLEVFRSRGCYIRRPAGYTGCNIHTSKINSSSRVSLEGKYIRLATNS